MTREEVFLKNAKMKRGSKRPEIGINKFIQTSLCNTFRALTPDRITTKKPGDKR